MAESSSQQDAIRIGHASTSKGSVLVVGSNARVLRLQGNQTVPTGNYLNEMVVPMQALRAAGYELVVATPDGTKPTLDGRSLVVSHFGGDEAVLTAALKFFDHDASLQNVVTLRSVIDAGLENIDGVFVPGGHAPLSDLVANTELGEILRHAHAQGKPTALLCHGPIAVLAAMRDAPVFEQALISGEQTTAAAVAREWQYNGYRMTIFSISEERPVETNVFGARLLYSVADALTLAGGRVEHGAIDYEPFVVVDRELITGQNPRSDHQLATQLINALNARAQV